MGNEQDIACGDVERRAVILGREGPPALDDDGDGEPPIDDDGIVTVKPDDLRPEELLRLGREGRSEPPSVGPTTPQGGDPSGREGVADHALQCGGPRQPEEGVRLLEAEPLVLEHDREVSRLLQLDEQDARADRVGLPGRHEDRVATGDLDRVERREESLVLGVDEGRELVGLQAVPEADPDGGTRLGVEDEPGLGLAVVAVEVPGGEGAVGVRVDREPLTAVEQLGQQLRLDAELGDVRCAEPALSRRPRAQPAASCRRRAR